MSDNDKMEEKDTYKYHLIIGHKTVHKDITYDWARREAEHQEDFPGSRIKLIGRRTTHRAALKWLNKGGKRTYNKIKEIKNGKAKN